MNVKDGRADMPIIYLMKKDPELPFGDFTITTYFSELGDDENRYITNSLELDDDVAQPFVYEVKTTECKTDQLMQPRSLAKNLHRKSDETQTGISSQGQGNTVDDECKEESDTPTKDNL